jgi:RNA recognition motif-containing protein
VSCQIIKDNQTGASKGFGFIEMADEEAAHKAIDALHKKKVKGSRIRVKMVS